MTVLVALAVHRAHMPVREALIVDAARIVGAAASAVVAVQLALLWAALRRNQIRVRKLGPVMFFYAAGCACTAGAEITLFGTRPHWWTAFQVAGLVGSAWSLWVLRRIHADTGLLP